MVWPEKASSSNTAIEERPKEEKAGKQRTWVLRYKFGNHPADSGTILASSRERAEAVGRAWCLKKGSGQMQQVRFISVEDPVLADESILAEPDYAT
jgi:hypothetical protein